jgi:hypothetical protein
MKNITVVLPCQGQPWFERMQQALLLSPLVRKIFVVHPGGFKSTQSQCKSFAAPSLGEGQLWNRIIGQVRTGYLLLIQDHAEIEWGPGALERLADAAETTKAGMI